jgi:predicted porin
MKKTIIAAAIASVVAAPAAFAEVKISGNVIQEFVTDSDDTGISSDGLETASAVDVVFSVSEDLGNGMSAFAKIHTMMDNGSGSQDNADNVVGLKGDFGTIVTGRMESMTEAKVDAMAATDSSDKLSIEINDAYDTKRFEGGLAYVSPSFNGLTFAVAGFALPNGGTASVAATTISATGLTVRSGGVAAGPLGTVSGTSTTLTTVASSAANSKNADGNFDATEIMVEYANGPLLVRASYQDVDAGVYNVSGGKDQKTTALAASYKMDNITLVGTYNDVENGGGNDAYDVNGYFVGAKIAAGANTFGLGYLNEDDQDAVGDNKAWMISVDHALSKRTSITAAYKDSDDDGTEVQQTAIGIKHVF